MCAPRRAASAILGRKISGRDLGGLKTEDAGCYAVEAVGRSIGARRQLIAEHAKTSDVIITTAAVPDAARAIAD